MYVTKMDKENPVEIQDRRERRRMILDEAIKHAEEVAVEQDKLCKRYDDASGYSRSHNEAIRTTDAKRCEKCASEHRQLAEWLKDYKRLKERELCEDAVSRQAVIRIAEQGQVQGYEWQFKELNKLPSVNPQETVSEFADRCRECGKMKRCRDCKYFEYNSVANVDGIPLIVAHEICSKWGDGCKSSEDGYCFLFEPKEDKE